MTDPVHLYIAQSYRMRLWRDRAMRLVLVSCALVALLPLVSVLVYVASRGASGITLGFFTNLPQPVGAPDSGMGNAVLGTVILVAIGCVVGVGWGVSSGVYLSEYGSGRLAAAVRFSTDVLAGIPSIVIGLFVYAAVVVPMQRFSALAGGLALGVLMIPTIARSTEDMLRLVPGHIREAGLALGIARWKVILHIVLRGSIGSIITAVMLAVARVAGETAPLLFTAFGNRFWPEGPLYIDQPIASLPVQIYNYAISPFSQWHAQAWTAALVLILLVFSINLSTRLVFRKSGSGRE